MKFGKMLLAVSCLMMITANPHLLEGGVNAAGNGMAFLKRAYIRLEGAVKNFVGDTSGIQAAIIAGIMIVIIGFATLMIGNYIIYSIANSLPTMTGTYAANYTATMASTIAYANTVMPLFGLGMMVLGFAIILYTLRGSMGDGGQR